MSWDEVAEPLPLTSYARATARSSSLVESLRVCGLSGLRMDKEDLKMRIRIPDCLRPSMARAILTKDPGGGSAIGFVNSDDQETPPDCPIVIFINSRSGGRQGAVLKGSSSSWGTSRPQCCCCYIHHAKMGLLMQLGLSKWEYPGYGVLVAFHPFAYLEGQLGFC